MSSSIQYKEFVITPWADGPTFRCSIVHQRGRPFVVGRGMKSEFRTTQFATEADAIRNAKLIASLATARK
ncbi:MAG TPA: hypothetical protein VLC74_05105 [Rhizomicrobium sp.]|nr:hypothetical protein [Rhizomicrobium sp.]